MRGGGVRGGMSGGAAGGRASAHQEWSPSDQHAAHLDVVARFQVHVIFVEGQVDGLRLRSLARAVFKVVTFRVVISDERADATIARECLMVSGRVRPIAGGGGLRAV